VVGGGVGVVILDETLTYAEVEVYTVMPLGHVWQGSDTVTVVGSKYVLWSVVVCSSSMVIVVRTATGMYEVTLSCRVTGCSL
jgi:hypothetical protein